MTTNPTPPRPATWLMALGLLYPATLAPNASAQEEPPLIDRAVGDLDPMATSLRRVDPAITQSNQDQLRRLRSADPLAGTTGQFEFTGQGFRATFAQPDYITLTNQGPDLNQGQIVDGAFAEIIPPGTIFHLGPDLSPRRFQPVGPDRRRFTLDAMDGRRSIGVAQPIDPRLHRAPIGSIAPRPDAPHLDPLADPPTPPKLQPSNLQPWVTAEDLREAQRIEVPQRFVLPGDPDVVPWLNPPTPSTPDAPRAETPPEQAPPTAAPDAPPEP